MTSDTDRALALLTVIQPRLVDAVRDGQALMRARDVTVMLAAAEDAPISGHRRR